MHGAELRGKGIELNRRRKTSTKWRMRREFLAEEGGETGSRARRAWQLTFWPGKSTMPQLGFAALEVVEAKCSVRNAGRK
jgi:hypothetical protein